MIRLLLLFALSGAATASAFAADARPYSGIGVVLMNRSSSRNVALYRWPGVGRLQERRLYQPPRLERFLTSGEKVVLPVFGKKGEWLKVACDESGREGWMSPPGGSRFVPWERFLPGQQGRILAGLKPASYQMREEPSSEARLVGEAVPGKGVRFDGVLDDWLLVSSDGIRGWTRWRDGEGRLLIAVE